MAINFRKDKNKINEVKRDKVGDAGYILEESSQNATSNGHQMYNFLNGIRTVDSNYINNDLLIDKMSQDSVISAALDIWTEDALQKDPLTGEIFNVEVDSDDSPLSKELSEGLAKRLNNLLKIDLAANKYLSVWCKRILKYGNCYLKLDFADRLDDERLKLKESSECKKKFTNIAQRLDKMINENNTKNAEFDSKFRQLDSRGALNEAYAVNYEEMMENIDNSKVENKKLIESFNNPKVKIDQKVLKEEVLATNSDTTISGRWYTEILGHGTNLYELSSKQKVVAYIDRDAVNQFIKPSNIINFNNNTGKHRVLFEVGDIYEDVDKKEYYQLERGEGFLENAMVAWQVLSALEDILLLTRMTRSILYRIFSVQVGNKDNKETAKILDRLKNRLKMEETVDIRSRIYSSTLTQVPLADSIFIPMHGDTGAIDVKTVGGDVNLRDAIDLDYFRDKLHSALRIPAPYLSYTESLPGGIGDSSLTRMDIRYSRTIARIQNILAEGLKDICLRYLELTIGEKALNELPNFKVKFTSINSAEDASRAELQKTFMETLSETLKGLAALGIDLSANPEGYKTTRETLLNQYFGSVMAQAIKKDELAMSVTKPEEMADDKSGNSGDMGDDSPDMDFGGGSDGGLDLLPNTGEDSGITSDDQDTIDNDEEIPTNTNELS